MKINLHKMNKNGHNFPIIELDKFVMKNNNKMIKKDKKKIKFVRKDFHGYLLTEVKSWLVTILPEFLKNDLKMFDIVHGYHNGTAIRDYIRIKFKTDFEKYFHIYKIRIIPIELGRTILCINLNNLVEE